MNVRRETPRPSDTACWPCGFSSIAPTRDGVDFQIASMTRRTSPGWTESPAFTLTFTIIPGMSAVTSISVDPPGSKEFLDVRPFDALPLHRGLEGLQDLRRVRRVAVDADTLDVDADVLAGDRGHLPLLQKSDESARNLVRVPGFLRPFEGERAVREVVQLDEPFRDDRETAVLGDLVRQGMGHRIQEEFRIVFLNPFDDAFGQLLVVDRDRVHRPVGLDVL